MKPKLFEMPQKLRIFRRSINALSCMQYLPQKRSWQPVLRRFIEMPQKACLCLVIFPSKERNLRPML